MGPLFVFLAGADKARHSRGAFCCARGLFDAQRRSPDERSDIRERRCKLHDRSRMSLRSSGLRRKKKEIKKETERRETRSHDPRHRGRTLPFAAASGAARVHQAGRARLSAFHRGSRRPVVTVPAQLQARLPGTRTLGIRQAGITRPFLSQSRGSTPHSGRSTGARDARSRPGAGGKPARRHRTRSYRPACRPRGVLLEREFASCLEQNMRLLSSRVTL
jgi:hypothetical protein